MSPTLTWVPGTYNAARRDDVLDPIAADILHVDGTPTRWAVQIEHDPKGVTDIGDVFFAGMRLPFVAARGRAPGLDCAADLIAKYAAAARAIAEAIIAKAGLLGTDDAVEIVKRMEATWPDLDRAAYLGFVRAADPSPPDGYIPAPVGCDDEDDDWSDDGEDHWGDDGGPELVAALNLCTTLRAERDAALADVTAWRGFAGSVAVAVHPDGTGAVIADHLAVDDLPDLLAAVERVVAERDAAEADAEDVRVALLAALRGGE
jgi:hypothetical protein